MVNPSSITEVLLEIKTVIEEGGGGGALTAALGLVATGINSQADALQLTANLNEVVTSSEDGNSVKLPVDLPVGSIVSVTNKETGNGLNVFPNLGSRIDYLAPNAVVLLQGKQAITLWKASTTQWYSLAGAPIALLDAPP